MVILALAAAIFFGGASGCGRPSRTAPAILASLLDVEQFYQDEFGRWIVHCRSGLIEVSEVPPRDRPAVCVEESGAADFVAACHAAEETGNTANIFARLKILAAAESCAETWRALADVETLDLRDSALDEISPLMFFRNLRYLDVRGNHLVSLASLQGLKKIEHLLVSDNQIVSLEPLKTMAHLRSLDAAGNRVESLRPLSTMRTMTYLRVSWNPIGKDDWRCPTWSHNWTLTAFCKKYLRE